MSRKIVIAGNWKMYKNRDEALAFLYEINLEVPEPDKMETAIFAPTIHLTELARKKGDNLIIGAQNMHYLEEGAFTGETSPIQLTNVGIKDTLIGHSERRTMFNETDEIVNKKVLAAIKHGIRPIVCIGEPLEIREKNQFIEWLTSQIKIAYQNVDKQGALKTIVAYEPIWAIGTGKTATPKLANDTIKVVRKALTALYGKSTSDQIRILYGGSVNSKNIAELLSESDIDGALIGGASLVSENFLEIVKIAARK